MLGIKTGSDVWLAISAIAGVLAVVGIIATLVYLVRHDRAEQRARRKLKELLASPLDVTYLVPKRDYAEVLFEGAGETERTPMSLTVGIGTYRIMHLCNPKIEVDVGPPALRFEGAPENKPRLLGRANPFIVERLSSGEHSILDQVKDWNGEVRSSGGWPRHYLPGEPSSFGTLIQTSGEWHGTLAFTIQIIGAEWIKVALAFRVSANPTDDEIPFLEGADHGETKERAARKAANQTQI